MQTIRRSIAALEILLIFPASLFMLALFVRDVQPPPYQPAETARHIVDWFAARPHIGLHIFLIALPFSAFVIGCAAVIRAWRADAQLRHSALQTLAGVRGNLSTLLPLPQPSSPSTSSPTNRVAEKMWGRGPKRGCHSEALAEDLCPIPHSGMNPSAPVIPEAEGPAFRTSANLYA